MFTVGNIQTVAIVSCMMFGNALAFLIKPNTITENRKIEIKERERERVTLRLPTA